MPTQVRAWPGMRSEYSWLPVSEGETTTRPHQLGVAFSAHRGAVLAVGVRERTVDIAAGQVFVTGADPIVWRRIGETTEALEIYPDAALVAAVGPAALDIGSAAARDGVVLAAAGLLRQAHLGRALSDIAASTLAHRLAEHLVHRYGPGVPDPPTGVLPWPVVDRVAELVEAHLGEVITLDRLAQVGGLSPYHFARRFRATTGLAPHQFVTGRRIERAAHLLSTGRDPISSVAGAVGMPNVSHFRRLFRRHTGVTPGQLRTGGPWPGDDLPTPQLRKNRPAGTGPAGASMTA